MNRQVFFPAVVFLAWFGTGLFLCMGVPLAKKRFNDYGVMVPWETRVLFDVAEFWPVPLCFAGLAGAAAWYAARHHPRRAGWACLLLLLPAGFLITLIFVGIALPNIALAEGLSK